MQGHQDYFINRLQNKTPGSSLGFVRALGIIVVFSAVGFLSFWSYDFLERSCPIAWCSFWLPLTAFGLARAVGVMPALLAG